MILATVNAPDGATLEYTARYLRAIEAIGRTYPEFDRVFVVAGNPTVSQGVSFMRTVDWDERKRSTLELARVLQPQFMGLPGVTAFPITPPSLGQGFRERSINYVIVTSDSYDNLARVSQQFLAEMAKNPGFVQPDTDLRLNKPEIFVEVDRARAADMGVSVDAVARTVETMLGGRAVTRYKRDADQYDVIVQTEMRGRTTPEDIEKLFVRGRGETMVPLTLAGQGARSGEPARAEPLQPAPLGVDHRQPGARLRAGRGAAVHGPDGGQGAAQRLRHRTQRRQPRVPLVVGCARPGVRAGADVHLPGAVGAVRELRRSLRHPAGGAAVDGRRAAGDEVDRRHAQRVFADRADHAGRPDQQARHPDRRVQQPVAPAGPQHAGKRWSRRRACACARS